MMTMSDVSPQQFFRFTAEQSDLLQDLYRATGGLTEAEVCGLIRKRAEPGAPATAYVFNRLLELGILEAAPEATARYELTRPIGGLMRFLLRQYRLTSVTVIQSYFSALNEQTGQLEKAQNENNPDQWMRVALELADHLEDMRHDSRNNRNGVIATVMQLKTATDRITPIARYNEVNRLWQTYIIPLRDMIDSRKVLDSTLQRTRQVLGEVPATVGAGRDEILQRAEDILARLVRLRRDVLGDFEESLREIAPLYEELRRENALARGASSVIELMMRKGFPAAGLAARLGLPNWQMQGQFSDAALEAHMARLAAYTPQPPQPLRTDIAAAADAPFDMLQFDRRVKEALPIEDSFRWLAGTYPDQPPAVILRLYGRMHSARYGKTGFDDRSAIYEISGRRLRAHPMRINAHATQRRRHETT
jgi:hypothetical protein